MILIVGTNPCNMQFSTEQRHLLNSPVSKAAQEETGTRVQMGTIDNVIISPAA